MTDDSWNRSKLRNSHFLTVSGDFDVGLVLAGVLMDDLASALPHAAPLEHIVAQR